MPATRPVSARGTRGSPTGAWNVRPAGSLKSRSVTPKSRSIVRAGATDADRQPLRRGRGHDEAVRRRPGRDPREVGVGQPEPRADLVGAQEPAVVGRGGVSDVSGVRRHRVTTRDVEHQIEGDLAIARCRADLDQRRRGRRAGPSRRSVGFAGWIGLVHGRHSDDEHGAGEKGGQGGSPGLHDGPQRNVLRVSSARLRMLYWSHLEPTDLSGFQTMTMTAAVVRPSPATTMPIPTGVVADCGLVHDPA